MTELVTYGSVGGVGGNSGPYPATNSAMKQQSQSGIGWRGVVDPKR
jgi:hypothetical protein